MNSGVPGSPRNRGPPFQAHQYVRQVPSVSRLRFELIPLSRTRILTPLGNPVVKITAAGGGVGRRGAFTGNHDPVVAGLGLERDRAAPGLANRPGHAAQFPFAEAGEAARLALVGHDAFSTACAQESFFDLRAHSIPTTSFPAMQRRGS